MKRLTFQQERRNAMVSLIIVNYNGASLIADCLHALEDQTFQDFEVIIVENGSSDDSMEVINLFLSESCIKPRTNIVALSKNLGFAGGNNEGLQYASGKFIALLNNDTEPQKDWLQELCSAMSADPKTGICASKLVSHGDTVIDSAGDGYARSLKGFKRGEGESAAKFDQRSYIFGACAGAVLYRRSMLDDIGFFDDDFFLIHEDTDLNLRAKLAGWKTLFIPNAVVRHKVTSSIGYMSELQIYYSLRNSEFVRIKNIPLTVFLCCFPEFIIGFIAEFVYFGIKHHHFILFLRAKMDAMRFFKTMLKKRKEIMKTKKISNRTLLSEMTPVFDRSFIVKKLKRFFRG